jgi:amino acid transporter
MTPAAPALPLAAPGLRRELRFRDLVLFNVCAIASLRWIAAAARSGPGSLTLWLLAAVLFFLPSAVVIGRLSAKFPEEGGMYVWTKHAFGDRHGFLCSWFYFISTILYFPSLLLAGVTMTTYLFGSTGVRLAEDRAFALPVTFGVLWALFLVNFFGLRVAKWVSDFGGVSIFVTAAVLILLAVAAGMRAGIATHFHVLPDARLDTLNFWSQIAFAFIGLELAPVMSGEIINPRRDLWRAAVIAGFGCAVFYIAGTAALLVLLRPGMVSPMTGLAQAAAAAAVVLKHPSITILFAALIAASTIGQLSTWLTGNTRLPYAIGLDQYLPQAFARLHSRWRTPYVALLVQVLLASVFLLMCQLGETVRAAYQVMVDMTVIVTLIPFLYIFGSGFRFANRFAALSGLGVTILAIVFSALPTADTSSALMFEAKILGGCCLVAALGLFIFRQCAARRRLA